MQETGVKAMPSFIDCLAYSETMIMEEIYSSETSVAFQRSAWRYILDDRTFQEKIVFIWKRGSDKRFTEPINL
jgi:hypothetical protein